MEKSSSPGRGGSEFCVPEIMKKKNGMGFVNNENSSACLLMEILHFELAYW
jgi:hypothetical protein